MVKTFKNLLLHNRGRLGAESLHESSGTRGQPKLLKELSYVDVWPFYGKVKFASLCICMSSIHLNGKIVKSFRRLLLWSLWANFVQISYGATLVWGNKRLLKLSRSVTKMAAMPIYGKNLFFFFFFFFFFYLGFTALSRIFHLYRADRSSKVDENWSTRRKTTWPSVSRTWLSHIWPELGSNHSGEKPNGLRVNSLIH